MLNAGTRSGDIPEEISANFAIHPRERPRCPACSLELVRAAIHTSNGYVYYVWICDCVTQPKNVAGALVNAREWDDASLVLEE